MARPPRPAQARSAQAADAAPPPRRGRAAALASDAQAAAMAAFARAGFSDPALVLHWRDIAGPEVARIARPLRFSEKDGTLTLKAEPGAALFLAHESRALAARVNDYLGRPAVTRVKFVQGRLAGPPPPHTPPPRPAKTPPPGDPALAYAGPDGLKAALLALARWRRGD